MLAHARTHRPAGAGRRSFRPVPRGQLSTAPSAASRCAMSSTWAPFSSSWPGSLRPGGRISLLDLAEPEAGLLRLGHRFWSNYAVPLVGSLLSDAEAPTTTCPAASPTSRRPAEVVKLLEEAGFERVQHELLSGGISQLYLATRQPCGGCVSLSAAGERPPSPLRYQAEREVSGRGWPAPGRYASRSMPPRSPTWSGRAVPPGATSGPRTT